MKVMLIIQISPVTSTTGECQAARLPDLEICGTPTTMEWLTSSTSTLRRISATA